MAGHSKWANIRHKKAAQDAKRGKIFTKLIREIMVAARLGGGNPDANPRLRAAIAAAKAENMPKENIERAIKKGTGELEGESYEEITCEGYAPGGVAVLVEAMTDNRNRTISEIRHIFTRNGGNLGEAGCVAWMFHKNGLIVFDKGKYSEEELMEVALEAGAEDVKDQGDQYEVITDPADFLQVKQAFDERGMAYDMAEITMIPQTTVRVEDPKQAQQVLRLMELLEDHDDVQKAYANFDIPDELLQSVSA
ncbi:YebC/PmpR family DNA-binding transcriptional regulator [Thermodesulforhabdus norvegica]|uniref:Probable transcriptional regulatory protein SAMN05660836_00572 n=1 Tax=Thermodesulforhabdus norvegica TaxID=39841 RepID=A0A1I4RE68_9BACT|nr:YebC/PmpR family DNA-binding transcriptional regulator [Thermodesulforhabdus norvegica]SFM50582.1 DNA-binding regulatory protein, YebC/PmpR family [Thermodesulforhabdus norvegica]